MMVVALVSGLILGIIFFGGLWLTVKKSLGTAYAALWFLASSVIRTAIVLTGFYFIAQGSLPRILISVAGFVAARFLVLRFTKQFEQKQLISAAANQL
ncbi:F1F0 ATPase subunit 2 [Pedobacter sp. UYP30]|uniref:ATP synthase subunit I n=1 Tax=Pedobacter sp. UYP30 TaxID=1756400 RepID=UPI0033934D5C